MRAALLFLVGMLTCSHTSFSQRVSVHANEQALTAVLDTIRDQTGCSYVISAKALQQSRPVTIRFRSLPLREALDMVFMLQPLRYTLEGGVIHVWPRPARQALQPHPVTPAQPAAPRPRRYAPALKPLTDTLQEVVVYAFTGYTKRPQTQVTGAVDLIDSALFSLRPGAGVLERLEHRAPGLLFNHGDALQTDALLIRGRSTLFANARPLIVLGHFPYEGDPANIHPQDIASVTILKDAAAAGIWGARAANGVIVITPRTGTDRRQVPSFTFGSYLGVQPRPDSGHMPAMSSADFIGLEQQLFRSGYYHSREQADPYYSGHPPFTPVVETLIAERDGRISAAEAEARMAAFGQQDVRQDIYRYLYQTAIGQQYLLNATGRNTYLSAGHDRHTGSLTGQYGQRSTLRAHHQRQLGALHLRGGVQLVSRLEHRGHNDGTAAYDPEKRQPFPYARLADDHGSPLPLYLYHRQAFADAAHQKGLHDWQYRPLESIRDESTAHRTAGLLGTASASYRISNRWEAAVHYQREQQQVRIIDLRTAGSYFVRNLVNDFTQTDAAGAVTYRPIPAGDISDHQQGRLLAHQARAAVHYHRVTDHYHLQLQSGAEVRHLTQHSTMARTYHALQEHGIPVDTVTWFPVYSQPALVRRIDMTGNRTVLADRFRSFYLLADYRYGERLLLSAAIRTDRAWLYGPQANQTGAPFWSVGAGWLGRHLQLRTSYGVQGNIARQAYPQTTHHAYPGGASRPDPQLRWERSRVFNISLQARTPSNSLSGQAAIYHRQASNLLGEDGGELANSAGLQTIGSDVSADYRVVGTADITWHAGAIFSFSRTTVGNYAAADRPGKDFHHISGREMRPVTGRAPFGLYSFPWRGLDPLTGDPLGVVDGVTSNDWMTIYQKTPLAEMNYHGAAVPAVFGSLRQQLRYKHLSLSVTVSYQLGYYFRKASLNYVNLFEYWDGHQDYARRWQQPGDENRTDVPSLLNRPNASRDNVYRLASIHVLKGDHIRLEDLRLAYLLTGGKTILKRIPSLELSAHLNDVAVLWKANRAGIDPYYNNLPAPRSRCTLGLTTNF